LPCHGGRGVAHHANALLRAPRRRVGSAGREETLVRDLDELPSLQPRGGARTAERRGSCEAAQSVPATASPYSGRPPPPPPPPGPSSPRAPRDRSSPRVSAAAPPSPAPFSSPSARRGSAYRLADSSSITVGARPIACWAKGAGRPWRDGLA